MNLLQGMANGFGTNHTTFLHQDLAGLQSALPVLVVDQWQPARISRRRLFPLPGEKWVHDLPDAVRITASCHGTSSPRIEIAHQGDGFFAVPGPFDAVAARGDEIAEFGRGHRYLDLEITDVRNLPRHPRQQIDREWRSRDRGILNHDRNINGIGDDAIEIENAFFGNAESRSVIRRHDHHHGGTSLLSLTAARSTDR